MLLKKKVVILVLTLLMNNGEVEITALKYIFLNELYSDQK